jgi:hypothetical protein
LKSGDPVYLAKAEKNKRPSFTIGESNMRISRPGRTLPLFVTGVLAGVLAAGCSQDAERPPVLQSASSSATPKVSTDSVAAKTDSAPQPPAKPRRPSVPPRTDTAPTKPVTSPAASPAPSADASQDKWLKYDPATNTVTFELIAGPFTFNGYRDGGATLSLPPKANVVMNFVNKDGTPHSAIVISGDGPIPNSAADPAIPRAYTNKVLEGLPQEGSDVMRFQVSESGNYRIFCGVPGHGLSGMWIWMRVDPAAKTPKFGPTKA